MAKSLFHDDFDLQSTIVGYEWSCSKCTYNNSIAVHPCCEICGEVDPYTFDGFTNTAQLIPIWDCPRCTLRNVFINQQCMACGHGKPSLNPNNITQIDLKKALSLTHTSLTVRDRRIKHELEAEKIFQHIILHCRQNNTHFIDDQFTPSSRSIGAGSYDDVAQWLRIKDIISVSSDDRSLPLTIFSSPQPTDIQQGALGNCWLIAALALISEQPRLLEHILLTKTVNKEGVYLIRICHNGLWKTIIVDDCFPCTKQKCLVFSQAKRRQLYVPLIEKACAKVFGSYASLKSGNMLEGLQLLTGAPCDYIDLCSSGQPLDGDIVWAKLLSACESKLLIGVSTGGTVISREEYAREHIHANHAFSILAAYTLKTGQSRFVLVRDPHSRSRYTEDAVTANVLNELRQVNAAQRSAGAFWISWSRFLRYFSSITISTYKSSDFDVREAGKFTRSSTEDVTSYRFYVPHSSMVTISLLYHRLHRKTRSFHTQSFVLCDVDVSGTNRAVGRKYSKLISQRGGFTNWSDLLSAGYYVLIPFSISFWESSGKHTDFTIVIHSSIQLELTMKNKRATFLADCLIAALKKSGERKPGKDVVFYKTQKKSATTVFMVENLSRNKYLCVNIDIEEARNIRHSRHSRPPSKTLDCVPQQHHQLLFITEWSDKQNGDCRFKYTYTHYHETKISVTKPAIDISRHDLHSPRQT